MRQSCTRSRAMFLAAVAVLAMTSGVLASEKILPLQAKADFSRSSSAKPWSTYLVSQGGKRTYKLFLEPEYDKNRVLIGVDLQLVDARGSADVNLLNPHDWHGLQPYDFVASDLIQGAEKSTFGAHRTITVEGRGIAVQIDIIKVQVSPATGGGYQIDDLALSIAVDNNH
jgi:hypothetical protein